MLGGEVAGDERGTGGRGEVYDSFGRLQSGQQRGHGVSIHLLIGSWSSRRCALGDGGIEQCPDGVYDDVCGVDLFYKFYGERFENMPKVIYIQSAIFIRTILPNEQFNIFCCYF